MAVGMTTAPPPPACLQVRNPLGPADGLIQAGGCTAKTKEYLEQVVQAEHHVDEDQQEREQIGPAVPAPVVVVVVMVMVVVVVVVVVVNRLPDPTADVE